ncbi:MAG: glycosyltransferase [Campylobacterota bacterium]|nr:glycosyltransferase [Campylobacterota bacterium]
MKRLLYITDQQEYTDHGAIGPLFNGYLKEHMHVNIVYFTKFKHSFQQKGSDYVVPEQYTKEICCYLEAKGVDLLSYDFVFVRNMYDVLKQVLASKTQFNYKVGFRVSVPRTTQSFEEQELENKGGFLTDVKRKIGDYTTSKLINQCDLFMPISDRMEELFYKEIRVKSHPLPPGLDPERVQSYLHTTGDDITFIYVGTVDKLQRFEVILEALQSLKATNWCLHISTFNPDYVRGVIGQFPQIAEKITVLHAENLNELMEQIHACDIGIGLLPNLSSHGAALPAKVMDYYTCSMPTLLTNNEKNRSLFKDGENAFFCDYEVASITAKLEAVMGYSLDEIARIGEAGQKKLLGLERNYEIMAKKLYEELEGL